jgi:hypothetical protein
MKHDDAVLQYNEQSLASCTSIFLYRLVEQINFTVFQKIRANTLANGKEQNCKAIVQIKPQGIRILVLNENLIEVLAFDDLQFTKSLSVSEQISQFQHFISESALTELKISKIWFSYSSSYFTLLPASLFSKEKAKMALDQVCDLPSFFLIQNEKLSIEAQIIYGLHNDWLDWTNLIFDTQEICWICNETNFIESGIAISEKDKTKICLAMVENDFLFFGVFSDGKLLFFNRFAYKTENDLLYFCLLGMQETGMEPETTRLLICGSLLPGSMGMEKLSRYFGEIEFAKPLLDIQLDNQFEVLKHHNYFDLSSQIKHLQ